MQVPNERMQQTDIDIATGWFAGLNTYVNRLTISQRLHNRGTFHSHS